MSENRTGPVDYGWDGAPGKDPGSQPPRMGGANVTVATSAPFGVLARVWWAMFWRYLVALAMILVVAFMVGLVLGLVGLVTHIDKTSRDSVGHAIGFCIGMGGGVFASIRIIGMILGKSFGGYRLVFLKEKNPQGY
ncbi:MAG: hypothetical protein GC185_05095 [Alphaproteobacteria bacterium]|nr:hypothetical protein [Alphaproteobacteria bacterium]